MDKKNLVQPLKKIDEIHVKGQYGVSFRAEKGIATQEPVDGATILDFATVLSSNNPETYFIKCPDPKLSRERQEKFVNQEFENGSSINHVADRLKDERFTINKMIGKGVLHDPQRGTEDQPCLIYEYAGSKEEINCTLARKWQNAYLGSAMGFLTFADRFARAVQVLHNQGIVHTFLVPRNIIWDGQQRNISLLNGRFTLVGFGYARYADAAGRHTDEGREESQFKVADEDNWFRAPECRGGHSHAAFGYPADIYSIGATLYSVLLARDSNGLDVLKRPPTDDRLLKQRVAKHLADEREHLQQQEDLLQENENILKIIDNCLRYDADDRYSCVEELIEAIQIATRANPSVNCGEAELRVGLNETGSTELVQVPGSTGDESDFVKTVWTHKFTDSITQQYFSDLKINLAEVLGQRYAGLGRGHFEVYGHRDRIVTSLCRLLGSAQDGDLYRTMTLPDYWTDANLGSLGRFLTMNKHMARHGVKIERLFLASQDFHNLPEEEQVVLEEQLRALQDLEAQSPEFGRNLVLKVLKVSEERIADFELNGELVAYLESRSPHGNDDKTRLKRTICLNFFSTAKEEWRNGRVMVRRTIKKARYWNPEKVSRTEQFKASVRHFENYLETAELLKYFIYPQGQPTSPSQIYLDDLIGTR